MKTGIKRSKNVAIAAPITLALLLISSCSGDPSELSRAEAKRVIARHNTFIAKYTDVHWVGGRTLWGYKTWLEEGGLNNPAFKGLVSKANDAALTLSVPISARLDEITGITDSNVLGQPFKEVHFKWSMPDVPALLRPTVVSGGTGAAFLKRYDDGWRLDPQMLQMVENTTRATLSAAETAQIEKFKAGERIRADQAAIAASQAAVVAAQREEELQRKTEESKIVTREIAQFDYVLRIWDEWDQLKTKGTKPLHGKITDVNIQFDEADHSYNLGGNIYWFGCLSMDLIEPGKPPQGEPGLGDRAYPPGTFRVFFRGCGSMQQRLAEFANERECRRVLDLLNTAITSFKQKWGEVEKQSFSGTKRKKMKIGAAEAPKQIVTADGDETTRIVNGIVADKSGLITVTKHEGNALEFDLSIRPTFGPLIWVPSTSRWSYHLPKDVLVIKNGSTTFTDGPKKSIDGNGTQTLQFRLLDGDTVPTSVHIIYSLR
jgi:hypothetical protein